MQKCRICGGSDFYKEAGYFFCQTCQTQNEDIRDEVLELRIDSSTRLRKRRIRPLRSDRSGEELGWTSWELYNFVLIGLTNELIELGVPSDIKLTILQLWATYLSKIEVAFTSKKKKCVPKLSRRYNKRDAEIIFGKVQAEKKSRKRKRTGSTTSTSMISGFQSEGSSIREINRSKQLLINADYDRYMQSQASSEGDGRSSFTQSFYSAQSSSVKSSDVEGKVQFSSHAKEEQRKIKNLSKNVERRKRGKYVATHTSTQYKTSPHIITPMRLWAIIYLALRIHNQPIHLGDMLRYGREGHLSYYKLDHLLPPEIILTKSEIKFLSQNTEITHKGMRRLIANMAKLLGVWDIICPDFLPLVNRYCQELGLPRGIQLYTERLIALSPPKMTFDVKRSYIPNYEGRAMAFIIVVLKTLFALDGITEYQISRVAEKINSIALERGLLDSKLFSFREWQGYVECRKTILVHSHFPTKLKYSPDTHGIDSLYIKFLEFIHSKGERQEPEASGQKNYLPEELITAMKKYIINLSENDLPAKEIDLFPASLTPLHSYLQQLLSDPLGDLPIVVRNDFFQTKVGYMTKLNSLIELATQCNIALDVIDSNLHFLEKVVPLFEQTRIPSVEELQQLVEVEDDINAEAGRKVETFDDYAYRKIPCKMWLNVNKQRRYDSIRESMSNLGNFKTENDFLFPDVLPSGKLAIPTEYDSDVEDKGVDIEDHFNQESVLLGDQFCNKYNLRLSRTERESINKPEMMKLFNKYFKKRKSTLARNAKGQYIKADKTSEKIKENLSDEDGLLEHNDRIFNNNLDVRVTGQEDIGLQEFKEERLFGTTDINISNIDISNLDIDFSFKDLDDYINLSNISLFLEKNETTIREEYKHYESTDNTQFFRPFKNYWMYHCIFSRVKQRNFELFEKILPKSFRWLLNECAKTVEMSTEDLYEEVCLIETYHAHILKSNSSTAEKENSTDAKHRLQNFVLNKW